jgi:multimeric flavodoxin WrbA
LVVINASPRKKGNTAELCKKVADGAMDNGADVEFNNLYSYDFNSYLIFSKRSLGAC